MKYFLSISFVVLFFVIANAKVIDDKENWQQVYCSDQNIVYAGGRNTLQYFENDKSHTISLPADMLITAVYAANHQVLLGTGNGDLYLYSLTHDSLHFINHTEAPISGIHLLHDKLYISTLGMGYAVCSVNGLQIINTSRQLKDNFIYQLCAGKKGLIWGCSDHGIFSAGDAIVYPDFNSQLDDKIVTAFTFRDEMMYCGTQKGSVFEINLRNLTARPFMEAAEKGDPINDLMLLDHCLIVATNHGAFSINLHNKQKTDTLVSHKKIMDIAADHSGAVWLAGDNMLARFYVEFFDLITSDLKYVHALTSDSSQHIWFTPDIGLSLYNTESCVVQHTIGSLGNAHTDITCLYMDTQKRLWIGTSAEGVFVYNTLTRSLNNIPIGNSVETAQVLSIAGNQHSIWVSTLNGIWYGGLHDSSHSFRSLEDELKLKKNYVYAIHFDKDDNLWLATDGHGILKLQNQKLQNFSLDHRIATKTFLSVIQDNQNRVWCNAYLDGLYCINGDSVYHLNKENGLQSNDIASIHMLSNLAIAAVSAKGIDIISTVDRAVTQFPFSMRASKFVPELNSIKMLNGALYIGTDQGILRFQIPSYLSLQHSKSFISSVKVLGEPVSILPDHLNYKQNYLTFNIESGQSFEEKTYLRYQLEGLSNKWTNTLDHEISFPGLSAGNYTFKLQTANNSRFQNATQESYHFVIDNPFWKKWWFLLTASLITFLLIWQYIRYRERKVYGVQLLAKEKAIAEYEALKAQINPHFLFNSFNTLMQVIDEDQELAIDYTQHLSDFYRSLIAFKEHDIVTLKQDLEILDNYFYLQKMRFGTSLNFIIDIPSEYLEKIMIPPLTLQMLAENAIKHNIIADNKKLNIRIFTEDADVVFENNLQVKMTVEKGENLGLQNIRNRYTQYTNREINIIKTDTLFIVKLPKIYHESTDHRR